LAGNQRMSLRVPADADALWAEWPVVNDVEQFAGIGEGPWRIRRIAPDHEEVVDARGEAALEDLVQMRLRADHAGGHMQGYVVAERAQPDRAVERAVDPVVRRGGHRQPERLARLRRLLLHVAEGQHRVSGLENDVAHRAGPAGLELRDVHGPIIAHNPWSAAAGKPAISSYCAPSRERTAPNCTQM